MTPEQEQRIFDVLNEQLKKFPNDVEVYCHRLERLVHGSVRRDTKKNKYLVQVGMNATELLTDECKGIPMAAKHYKMIPFLLFIEPKNADNQPYTNVKEEKL